MIMYNGFSLVGALYMNPDHVVQAHGSNARAGGLVFKIQEGSGTDGFSWSG